VGLWESLTGRSRAPAPDLDALFLVPSAAITLETALGLRPTGSGSVCFRAPVGAAYDQVQDEVVALLRQDDATPDDVRVSRDSYGFTWLAVSGDPADTGALCTDLHAVNSTLSEQGFAGGLLCTLVPFSDGSRTVGLVYLYKQGTFYPFAPAPAGAQQRDNLLEIAVRDALAGELPMERDLQRWLAVWGAPGL
jgi:hypothetical protein